MTQRLPLPGREWAGVRGEHILVHPHLNPPPSRGRITLADFHGSWVTSESCEICLRFVI
jgi:hypothetical protein